MEAYLDNNATTAVDNRVVEAMNPYWNRSYGNPSSLHGPGRDAEDALERARGEIARAIGARAEEIVFTSGGTEADNLALRGVIAASRETRPHLVTSAVEHPAVLRMAEELEREQVCEWTVVPVDREGLVAPDAVEAAIRPTTALVSVMSVNNETGAIQPVEEIAARCREHGVPLHTDAVQALGKIAFDVTRAGVDLATFSAHKLHGPKGVGALWIRRGVRIRPLFHGGGQQRGLRPGTLPVPLVVGFGEAVRLHRQEAASRRERVTALGSRLLRGLEERIDGLRLNGPREMRVPHTINVTLPGTTGEALLIQMDQAGIAVSTGSACASGSALPSHVLTAMGLSRRDAQASLRLGLSALSRDEEVDRVLEVLPACVERLRAIGLQGRRP